MDRPKDLICINLTDKDGIVVNNTLYKIANGAKIIMYCKGYPVITWDNYTNTQENMHTKITTTNTLSNELGPVKFSGNMRPTIKLQIYVPINDSVPTQAAYASMSGSTPITFYLLYNLWRYPHRIYLNDLLDNTEIPNVDYPINILINRKDLLGQTIFSADGVPVVLKKVSFMGEGYLSHADTINKESAFEYELEFLIDNYGT